MWYYYDDTLKMLFPKLQLNKPRTDSCEKCDTCQIKIKNLELKDDKKKTLEKVHSLHLRKAMAGYDLQENHDRVGE